MNRAFQIILNFTFLLLLVVTVSCLSSGSTDRQKIIASVSGQTLTLQQALDQIPSFMLQQDSLSAIAKYSDQWVRSVLVTEHARYIGLDKTENFKQKMDDYKDQLLEKMLEEMILQDHAEELNVTENEARQYYQTYREQFLMNERYIQFRFITTQTRTAAENANRDLINGVEWDEIVDTYSVNPEYQKRFSTQYWPESIALPEHPQLQQYLSYIGITERSPISYSNGHYHFVQLMDELTEGEYPDLDWLIPQIQEWLVIEKSRRIVNAYRRNLYLQAETNNEIESTNVTELNNLLNNSHTPE